MNTEQKAKAYDEALERARQFSEHPLQEDSSNIVEYIFPELQESKDERIRKEIIETFKNLGDGKIPVDINYADIFTWLEKQGEQKSKNESIDTCDSLIIKSKEFPASEKRDFGYFSDHTDKKPIGKIEPKFREGDWVIYMGTIAKILDLQKHCYVGKDTNGKDFVVSYCNECEMKKWDISDAKDGDVLVASDGSLFIFAKLKDNSAYYHFSLCKNGSKEISDGKHAWETANSCYPATKFQRDTLLKAMTDAGYEWDAEKKELKKIEQKPAEEYSFNIESELFHQLTKEQQELWKKEIEQAYNAGVEASDEWSEEDETKMRAALAFIKSEFPKKGNEEIMEDTIKWLKSIKTHKTWRPSEEQMYALAWALSLAKNCGEECAFDLRTLLEQLKNL